MAVAESQNDCADCADASGNQVCQADRSVQTEVLACRPKIKIQRAKDQHKGAGERMQINLGKVRGMALRVRESQDWQRDQPPRDSPRDYCN